MCDKAVDIHPSVLQFVPEYFKTKVVCNKAFPKDLAKICLNFLTSLKFVSDQFVTSKMIKKLYNALFADDDILFFDEGSGNVTFQVMKWIFQV